ncbi:Detected protein of confused Function [Hibiscus syriacus]|uniref:Glycosyltransferase n=1 Tax=Hibiscus syriacus TaxID=106335 RepID=A0A6A3AUT5_HIBSY|nr:Detected protein of confused Function [Hibiscus syriacus]
MVKRCVVVRRPTYLSGCPIGRDQESGSDIDVLIIKFPSMEAGLPEGIEIISSITSQEMGYKFFKAVSLLQQPLQRILEDRRPDCLIADGMFLWSTDVARMIGILMLVFHGTNSFASSVLDSFQRYEPPKTVTSDDQPFEVPGIPDKIMMTRRKQTTKLRESGADVEITALALYPSATTTRRTNHKGGMQMMPLWHRVKCLRWLDSKKHNSVLYICFGSVSWISAAQLNEIAKGIEESGRDFLWVVRKTNEDEEEWLPKGFEERMKGKGLIIRGWAPQVLILGHETIGGFMTHCGWNSTLESITAEEPMVNWPLSNEQFINEKFITDIPRVGVGVGAHEWSRWMEGKKLLVTKENITKAITEVMLGKEANNMKDRVNALKWMAKRAVEEGGSSHTDLMALLDGLRLNNI